MVFKRIIQFIAGLILLLTLLTFGLFWYGSQQLHQSLGFTAPIQIEVQRGMHARTILHHLNQQGATLNVTSVYLASRVLANPQRIQAGVYELTPSDTVADLWRKLRHGEQYVFRVALIEGRTLAEWVEVLENSDHLLWPDELRGNTAQLQQRLNERLGTQHASFEGLLYPDTYGYTANTQGLDLLVTAYRRMNQELEQIWQQREADLPYATPYELLIMASIIEKETGLDGERGKVSSVFVNRLRTGMRLQSDPTTIYGIPNFDGNLTRAHLRELTAYNTYRIDGLPPTPIAMPSRQSLVAAAHPEQTDYFYFVADGTGKHVFSRTLAEHNRAVNRYQRNQR